MAGIRFALQGDLQVVLLALPLGIPFQNDT